MNKNYVKVSKNSILQYREDYDVLVCSLRSSRIKAKQLAILELFLVLSQIGCLFIINGPLGDIKGIISFFINKKKRNLLHSLLKNVGYCDKFYILDFDNPDANSTPELVSVNKLMWKGIPFSVHKYYEQDRAIYKKHSSHNRDFFIYGNDGLIKKVKGYRGDGSDTGRRALPVEDSRLMVNLCVPYKAKTLMDPFAGSGGILHEARYIAPHLTLISADIDPVLEPGLKKYADKHYAMDASDVILEDTVIDAIVTEVPFSPAATDSVIKVFEHLSKCLSYNGRIVFMCQVEQYEELKLCMKDLQLCPLIEKPVNRKGTDVVISAWYKRKEKVGKLQGFHEAVSKIY